MAAAPPGGGSTVGNTSEGGRRDVRWTWRRVRRAEGTVDIPVGSAQLVVPVVLGMALATGLLYLGLRWTADPMTTGDLRTCAHAAVVAVVGVRVLTCDRGTRLLPEYLEAYSRVSHRGRRIPWADIVSVDVRRSAGVRRVHLALVTGEHVNLAAPMSFLDRRFDARVEELTGWWESHRR